MAINQLKAGTLLSFISIALSNVIGLAYTPFLLRMMGQSEYGLYALAGSVVGYLTVLDLGFGNSIIRYTAKYKTLDQKENEKSLLGMFFLLYCAIGVISFILGLILYKNADVLFDKNMTPLEIETAEIVILLMVFNVSITFPFSLFSSVISAYEQYIFVKIIGILRIVIMPVIMIPMLFMGYKAIGLTVLTTILNMAFLLISFWYSYSQLKIRLSFNSFDVKLLKEIGSYSFFIFMAIIIEQMFWSSGQVILGATSGTAAVAVFAIGMAFRGYFYSFSFALGSIFFPRVVTMVSQNKSDKELSDFFNRIARIQYILLSFILAGFILFGKSFIIIWAGIDYLNSYYVAIVILIPLIIPLSQLIGINILQAKNKQTFRVFTYFGLALLSIILSIPLSKKYGPVGCVIGASISIVLGHIIIMNIYYHKVIKINIIEFWNNVNKISIPLIVLTGLFWIIRIIYFENEPMHIFIIEIILFILLYIPISWKFQLNTYEKELIKKPLFKLIQKLTS